LVLYDQKGRGRKPKFNAHKKNQIKEWVKENPKNLGFVIKKINSQWCIDVSKDTIKNLKIFFNMTWRRIKKGLAGKPEATLFYKEKVTELAVFKKLDEQGEIDLRYGNKTEFCLSSCVPYAWQEKGGNLIFKTQQSKRVNTLDFLNLRNNLEVYLFEASINSDVVIACLDKFS
jgi:hypothetical protein